MNMVVSLKGLGVGTNLLVVNRQSWRNFDFDFDFDFDFNYSLACEYGSRGISTVGAVTRQLLVKTEDFMCAAVQWLQSTQIRETVIITYGYGL
jgi:hypothetical protein